MFQNLVQLIAVIIQINIIPNVQVWSLHISDSGGGRNTQELCLTGNDLIMNPYQEVNPSRL
jgi:hypothetical protein